MNRTEIVSVTARSRMRFKCSAQRKPWPNKGWTRALAHRLAAAGLRWTPIRRICPGASSATRKCRAARSEATRRPPSRTPSSRRQVERDRQPFFSSVFHISSHRQVVKYFEANLNAEGTGEVMASPDHATGPGGEPRLHCQET